jgi:hypothetical protein
MLAGLFDPDGEMLWWAEQVRELGPIAGESLPPDYPEVMDQVVAALLGTLPRLSTE